MYLGTSVGLPVFSSPQPTTLTDANVMIGTSVVVTSACVELLSKCNGDVLDISSDFSIGDRLMVLDTVNKVCEVEILDVRMDSEIFVHYLNWPSKWDEWLAITSPRIKRRNRLSATQTSTIAGPALQLLGLVDCVGTVTQLARVASTADSEEMLIQVQVVDSKLGSTVSFWTKLNLVRAATPLPQQLSYGGLCTLSDAEIEQELRRLSQHAVL
jgi:hypothetical protein